MVHVIASMRPVLHTAQTAQTKARYAATDQPPSPADDFKKLFSGPPATPAADPPPAVQTPTAESVFGSNPWMANPTGVGPNGVTFTYNQYYFATPQTAATVAQMVGGKVVQTNQFTPNGGAFNQQQPNYMVQLKDGQLINPGLVASFYTHGYPQSYVDMMVASEVKNS